MVDDRNSSEPPEQLGLLHEIRAVGIHHDDQAVAVDFFACRLRLDDHLVIFPLLQQAVEQRRGERALAAQDDVCVLAAALGSAGDADRGTERVDIRVAVSHDEHLRGVAHELTQRIRHDARFDLGALFDFLGDAAEELKGIAVLDDRLVAAARQRHVQRKAGKIILVLERRTVPSDADGKRCVDALARVNLTHGFQNREFLLDHLFQIADLHHKDVAVAVIFAQDAVDVLGPLADALVDCGEQGCFFRVARVFDQLLIVVNRDDCDNQTARVVFQSGLHLARAVEPVQRHQRAAGCTKLLGAEQIAENPVVLSLHMNLGRIFCPSLLQPCAVKARDDVAQRLLKQTVAQRIDLVKRIVAPDDLSRAGQRDHDRHRDVGDRVGCREIRVARGDALQVLNRLPLAAVLRIVVRQIQNAADNQLQNRLIDGEKHTDTGKKQKNQKIKPKARLKQLG